jgi:hypothetical protein
VQPGTVGQALPPDQIQKPQVTAAQAKVEAVANLTMSAYQKAATLNITQEEVAKLSADFPDDAFKTGAAGKENLIYIEHAFLRQRMNEVFGMGQWALIPRNRWSEDFKTQRGVDGVRIYVEAMLVVRGCFVGEAVGSMEYYPSNGQQDYSDCVEGAKTAAFRRCAKEFGVGLQAWKKDWCEGWWQRKRGHGDPKQTAYTRQPSQNAPQSSGPANPPVTGGTPFRTNVPPKAAESAPNEPPFPTEDSRAKMLIKLAGSEGVATDYFREIAQLMPNEELAKLELRFVPSTEGQMRALTLKIANFAKDGKAERAFPAHTELNPVKKPSPKAEKSVEVPRDPDTYANSDDPNHPEAKWRIFPMPFGKNAGVCLEDLEKNYLFGLWANFQVETEYNGKPKKAETIAKDTEFRAMLDLAGEHYQFKKKD